LPGKIYISKNWDRISFQLKMESSKNNNSNGDGEDEQQQPQQPRRSAQKLKLNRLANDGKPAAGGEEDQPEQEECSSKKDCDTKNDQDLDLEVCTFLNWSNYKKPSDRH
jgi:hypothetical protein